MIAGVVATLTDNARRLPGTLDELASRMDLELGEFKADDRRIPLTIDSTSRQEMEEAYEWLLTLPGVALVDVVFVHYEESDEADMANDRLAPHSLSKPGKNR